MTPDPIGLPAYVSPPTQVQATRRPLRAITLEDLPRVLSEAESKALDVAFGVQPEKRPTPGQDARSVLGRQLDILA